MLKRILPILIYSFCSTGTFAQKSYLDDYHPAINRAEMFIVDEDYKKALGKYDSAFALGLRPASKDLYNACICAIKEQDNEKAIMLLEKMIAQGLYMNTLEQDPAFAPVRGSAGWANLIEKYHRLYGPDTTITNPKALLKELTEKDRIAHNSQLTKKAIEASDSLTLQQLIAFIERFGFPGERLVGNGNPKVSYPPGYILLFRYAENYKRSRNSKLDSLMFAALSSGDLNPYHFAFYNSLIHLAEIGQWGLTVARLGTLESGFLAEKLTPDQEQAMNERRKQFGLCTLADFYKKAMYVYRNPAANDFAFRIYEYKNNVFKEDQDSYNKYVDQAKKLE